MKKTEKTNKRFIAGAVCPKCGMQDKTVVYSIGGQQFTECVRCSFKQHAKDLKAKPQNKKIIWLKGK